MRKVNALVRHEIINLRRGKLIWIAAILYVVGVQQVISSMYTFGSTFMSLVGLIKTSWLPLNFIMIPLLLLSMNIGYSRNEVFETLDISPGEVLLSKVLTVAIVDGVILAVNILLAAVISVICKVSIGYFLYELVGYFVNTVIFLVVTGSIGLFIGQVLCRYVGIVVSFITTIILFILLSNFYKTFNNIVPLIDIRTSTSSFEVISYDKGYVLQNILWLMISLILLFVMYVHLNRIKGKVKAASLQIGALTVTVAVCVALVIGIESAQPTIFNMGKRTYSDKEQKYVYDNVETFFSKEDCGYYVEKYNMNLSIDNGISNNCEMNIRVNGDKVNTIELGLYKKLNISKVELDGEASKYDRTSNSFIVNLPREYKKGEIVKLKVEYSGIINTAWLQGQQLFFVRNNAIHLADLFEWYPKLNDMNTKEFTLDINYSGKNKIYSNLDGDSETGHFKFQGKSSEIFLISGNIAERSYEGYKFIGNEECINNNGMCSAAITLSQRKDIGTAAAEQDSEGIRKIVFGPFIPSAPHVTYGGTFLFSSD